jgi:predicted nucleotidyltransferase
MGSTMQLALPWERLRQIAAGTNARLVVLFGSIARGAARVDSDVDIGVSGLSFWEANRLGGAIGAALGREPHVVDLDTATEWLLMELARDGIVVYETAPDTWARFRAGAIVRWLDFAPFMKMCADGARRRLLGEVRRG